VTSRSSLFDQIRTRLTAALPDHPKLEQAVTDLNTIAPRFREAVQRMQDARPSALGAASYDGPTVTGGGATSSSTERLAVQEDRTADDRRRLDRALRELDIQSRCPTSRERWICEHAQTVWRIINAWTPHAPTDKQRETVEQSNAAPEPLCQCCTPHRAKGCAERVHRTGDAAGNLPAPLGLCHWCYRFALRTGRLPTKGEVQRNDNGQRVMVRA